MNVLKIFSAFFIFTIYSITYSQTGPGGVGSTNGTSGLIIWYRPDNGVSTTGSLVDSWSNSAGITAFDISETGTQRPTLVTNAINGYDEISFNGSNRLRTGLTLTSSNFVTNQASSFIVTRADNTWQTSSVYTTDPLVSSTRFSNHIPWNGSVYYDIGTCCSNDARIQVDGLSGLTSYSIWTYDAHPTTGKQLYRNQTLLQNRANTTTYNSHSSQRFNLGANTSGSNGFMGDVSELIIFKSKINTAQRIIINNYLSAKYNTALTSEDYYNEDNPGSGDFDHHVAGIGQASDGSNHTDSRGTGIVRISNPSALANNRFLFWGEETKNPSYTFSTNIINYTEQLNSRWRVSRSGGNIGTVTVSFDISTINLTGKQSCQPLQLIVDNNSNFSSPTVYNLIISGNTATATGVSFNSGNYFTLRYIDQIVWNGSNFYNGSGSGNAPNSTNACLKFTVKAGSTASLTFNAHVREVEVETGATLNVNNGVLLETENRIINNGTIDLIGEAQLIQNHTGTSSNSGIGNLKIRQQGTSSLYNYNYWSAPVNRSNYWRVSYLEDANGAVNFTSGLNGTTATTPITISSRWLYTFNGSIGNYNAWAKITPNTNLLPGVGYTLKGSGTTTPEQEFVFKGTPNSGNYTLPVTALTEYLIGNPYPSTLDANRFILDNLLVIDGTLYFWESFSTNNSHYLSSYEGGYATYNLLMSLSAIADASGLTSGLGFGTKPAPTRYINVGQGFFTTILTSGSIVFNNAQRAFARESLNQTVYFKNSSKNKISDVENEDIRPKIWFNFTDSKGYTKQLGLGYDEHASYDYDRGYDAKSYDNLKNDLHWLVNNESLIIQALPKINTKDILPLNIKITDAGLYKFSISNMENIPDNMTIYLVDNLQNVYYNLRTSDAQFILNSGTKSNQFSIAFENNNLLGTTTVKDSQLVTNYNPNNKHLELYKEGLLNTVDAFEIYNMMGQKVISIKSPTTNTINLSHTNDGVYILKVVSKTSTLVESVKFVKY